MRTWLAGQGDEPIPQKQLTGALRAACRPNERTLATVLGKYHLEAGNAGGQAAVNKLLSVAREAYRAREAEEDLEADAEGFTFNLRDAALKRELAKRGTKIVGEITKSMLEELRDVLAAKMYEDGLGPAAIAKDLERIFPQTYRNRAQTIARTETLFAQATVQNATFERNGVEGKQWLAVMDDRTRDDHYDMHGVTAPMGEPFHLPDGSEIDFPGDPGGEAEQVINCRCDYVPVFGDGFSLEDLSQPWLGG